MKKFTLTLTFLSVFIFGPIPQDLAKAGDDEFNASGYGVQRTEQEDKLTIPLEKLEEVWAYLKGKYVADKEGLKKLDPLFTSYAEEEEFTDVYFDSPDFKLLETESGVRHRKRINLTDPEDHKSGRELMQVKLNHISENKFERGEIKFDIKHYEDPESAEDLHPMLGIVKKSHRKEFKEVLRGIGLNPVEMKPVLTVKDHRRRVYILKNRNPFISLSVDHVTSELGGKKAEFSEIEPELNEIIFTDADAETKKYMEGTNAKIIGDLLEKFPFIKRDLTPKYNKSFNQLKEQGAF